MTVGDRIVPSTAAKLLRGERPMATCPADNEPLIMTMEFRGAEFICMVCKQLYGFLSPKPATWTQELQDRHDVLLAQYEAERAQRRAQDGG